MICSSTCTFTPAPDCLRDYFRQEAEFTKRESEEFYKCEAPDGSPLKEGKRRLMLDARQLFAKIWASRYTY